MNIITIDITVVVFLFQASKNINKSCVKCTNYKQYSSFKDSKVPKIQLYFIPLFPLTKQNNWYGYGVNVTPKTDAKINGDEPLGSHVFMSLQWISYPCLNTKLTLPYLADKVLLITSRNATLMGGP